ncbi:ribosomal protein L7Ae-like RNA K-turn-binding protein [Geomicrobium halophilum]|uniref:Ribosomal protein L7Ae-like RNA K-turn-binding protein n=1 Tax=Geomicrobium halophilum TaxID=549000 RepID=A0A841PKK4_9BACL|nr:YlxQ family RNA-binding protein [Geomicrobium halophilum]MBB6449269.1 ribosomal protein L7Ae-like RNA K-turn-binding protein [Geomicrobium halophilum]
MNQNFYQFLGLAARARKVVSGEDTVIRGIKSKRFYLVLISSDASENTKKQFEDKCRYYEVPLRQTGTRQDLGTSIGKHERVVLGITDEGFSDKIILMLDE